MKDLGLKPLDSALFLSRKSITLFVDTPFEYFGDQREKGDGMIV